MNKKGFTLAELMITLSIIGVMAVLSMQTIKTVKDKYAFMCYYLFRDLKIAVGHMAADSVFGSLNSVTCDKDNLSGDDYSTCISDAVAGNSNDNIIDYKTDTGFCKSLAKYLSAASKVECAAGDINNATVSNIYGNLTKPNFKLLNRNYVYVSSRQVGTNPKTYRIVSFDLNGHSSPNRGGKDIVSFAIFDNGEILPLGDPAGDPNYFMAVIKMRTTADRDAQSDMAPGSSSSEISAAIEKSKREVRFPNVCTFSTNTKKNLSFREAYCTVSNVSDNYPSYCTGVLLAGGKFLNSNMNVYDYCVGTSYASKKPECEYNVVKPSISKFFPVLKDVYSSKNNTDDIDTESGDANQIYMY